MGYAMGHVHGSGRGRGLLAYSIEDTRSAVKSNMKVINQGERGRTECAEFDWWRSRIAGL